MARKARESRLPAPFLKRLTLDAGIGDHADAYPFNLPWLDPKVFDFRFTDPVTIFVGENGSGKSTWIEAIAALCGYDETGGGKGYNPVDHSGAVDRSGADLARFLRAEWLPKITTGWFFKAETFFSVARYLDAAALSVGDAPPDFLSWSHGEGFVRFFEERMARQGVYFLDEPESALSPARQVELLRALDRIRREQRAQVLMATHSPILMALPGARLVEITRAGFQDVTLRDTRHFKTYQSFICDPEGFVADALAE